LTAESNQREAQILPGEQTPERPKPCLENSDPTLTFLNKTQNTSLVSCVIVWQVFSDGFRTCPDLYIYLYKMTAH